MHVLGTTLIHYANPQAQAVALVQAYSYNAGIKKFCQASKTAAVTKLTQLHHDYQVYNSIKANSLSPTECKTALESLMNIIEKWDGCICTCACANGSKECQEPGYKKGDGASPTVATNSIMITATIDDHERRNVATVDIPGAFLHVYNGKDTFMLLCICLAELMVQVNPALYRKCVIYGKNNKPHLYVKLSKAIYVLLKSALLFYKNFVADLKNYASQFVINPYEPCIANVTIGSLQC
jgi:hypothetical protein